MGMVCTVWGESSVACDLASIGLGSAVDFSIELAFARWSGNCQAPYLQNSFFLFFSSLPPLLIHLKKKKIAAHKERQSKTSGLHDLRPPDSRSGWLEKVSQLKG